MAEAPATETGIQGIKEELQKNNAEAGLKSDEQTEKVTKKIGEGTKEQIENADEIQKRVI